MILYLDTSSLVKLYLEEEGSSEVHSQVGEAAVVATSVLAYPEARSAFARFRREGGMTDDEHAHAKTSLERDWSSFLTLLVNEKIWRHAADLTEFYALRAFDSVHLASYLALANLDLTQGVEFSAHDKRLLGAARAAAEELSPEVP